MSTIIQEVSDGLAVLTLNRPDKFNSFNREMALSLQDALRFCQDSDTVRAVMITAKGKAFCAGQDLAEAVDAEDLGLERIVDEHYNPMIRLIRQIEKPVIAAVNGVAAGAGASIALACDIVVASHSASFIQAFSKIGLIPDSAGTFFLPRLIGLQRAAALMFTGDKVSATEAREMGMIYQVFPDDLFEDESKALGTKLAQMPTLGLGLTKRLLNQSYSNNLDEQLELEKQIQVEAGSTEDFKEGVAAFLEKRKPRFTGK